MTDRRLSRRHLLEGIGAGMAGSVAGCIQTTGSPETGACPSHDPVETPNREWATHRGAATGTAKVAEDAAPESDLTLDWTFPIETHVGYHTPIVSDGTVYVHDMDTTLYGLSAKSGTEQWQLDIESPGPPPAVAGDTVVVGTENGLRAYDTESREQRWTAFDNSMTIFDPSPVISAGTVYLPARISIYALDIESGAVKWRFPTGLPAGATVAVADGAVYAGGRDTYIRRLAPADGTERWQTKTDGHVVGNLSSAGGVVCAGTNVGTVYAVDATDGTKRWQYDLPDRESGRGPARPETVTTDGSRVYVTTDDRLFVLAVEDGTLCWSLSEYRGSYESGLAISNEVVYVPTEDREQSFAGFDIATGERKTTWKSDRGRSFTVGPALAAGAVYVSGNGAIGRFS